MKEREREGEAMTKRASKYTLITDRKMRNNIIFHTMHVHSYQNRNQSITIKASVTHSKTLHQTDTQ